MIVYVTFGQIHQHEIEGKLVDKDCVAVFNAMEEADVRKMLHDDYNNQYATSYTALNWDPQLLKYFPKGYVYINFQPEDIILCNSCKMEFVPLENGEPASCPSCGVAPS